MVERGTTGVRDPAARGVDAGLLEAQAEALEAAPLALTPEGSLRDAGNLLRILAAHTDGVVLELDADARIVGFWLTSAWVTSAWVTSASFFEKPDADLQGKSLIDALGGPQGQGFDELVRRVLSTGQSEAFEYVVDLRGERRTFAAKAVLMPGVEDAPARVSAVIRDITERTRTQTQLLEAERALSAGLLAAGVAHEINNPLAYTLLNLERLQSGLRALSRTDPGDPVADLLEAVEVGLQGGRRVQAIVRDLVGGRLAVEGAAGRGSVLRLLLPAAEEG